MFVSPDTATLRARSASVLGLWLILSPFVLGNAADPTPTWNAVIVGAVVAVLALCSGLATAAMPRLVRHNDPGKYPFFVP